jgi:NTE family protein
MATDPTKMQLSDIPGTSKIRNYRYLSLQGGGMKGIGFAGAIQELQSTGVLSQIEGVAGSSAGAIVATLVAVGYNAQEIRQVMLELDFRDLQDKDSPGWVESSGLKALFKGGAELVSAVDRYDLLNKIPIVKKALQFPGKIVDGIEGVEDMAGLALGSELGLWKGEALLNIVSTLIIRKTGKPNLTFRELEKLTAENPGVFRNLTLTGSNLSQQKLEYYNVQDWPDMPIMDAVRISASFPGGFKPVIKPVIKRVLADGTVEISPGVRVDGGLLENLPDVYNKPPFYTPTQERTGNPEVLAISFKEAAAPNKKIKHGLDLAVALYSTVMSEAENQEKYGDNIVYIDPKGVGTLDFDADRTRASALADSGGEALELCFKQMLASEKIAKPNFKEMNLNLLVRQEVALINLINQARKENKKPLELQAATNDLIVVQGLISKMTSAISSPEEREGVARDVLRIRKKERERVKIIERSVHGSNPTDQELVDSCKRKLIELNNAEIEIDTKLRQLHLVKMGLEFRAAELETRFLDPTGTDSFNQELKELKNFQDKIHRVREIIAHLHTGEGGADNNHDLLQSSEKTYQDWVAAKEIKFNEMIEKYRAKNDELMVHYFQELKQESANVLFKMPTSSTEVGNFLLNDLQVCDGYIKEGIQEKAEVRADSKIFEERIKGFEGRTIGAEQYGLLKELKNELEKSIYKKTGFIAKIANYLTSKWPSHKNSILMAMRVCNVCAFITKVGISFVPATVFSGVLRLMKVFSNNPQLNKTAERIGSVFNKPDLLKLQNLKGLSEISAHLLKVLDNNYKNSADKSKQTYLFRLFTEYLKNTGLNFTDVFPKNREEAESSYRKRIELFQKKLGAVDPSKRVLKDDISAACNDNIEKLRIDILKEIHKPSLDLTQSTVPQIPRMNFLKGMVRQQNLNQLHVDFIKKIDKKPIELITMAEFIEYVKSTQKVGMKVKASIQESFLTDMQEKIKRISDLKRLDPDEALIYIYLTNNKKGEHDPIRRRLLKECTDILPKPEGIDPLETKKALDMFFQMGQEKRKDLKANLEKDNKHKAKPFGKAPPEGR